MKKIAIPMSKDKLSAHFGHCEYFMVVDIDNNTVVSETRHTPPPHAPGVYPKWLAGKGVHEIIAGGMGQRAIALFRQNDINVHLGVPDSTYNELINNYLSENLVTGENRCDH